MKARRYEQVAEKISHLIHHGVLKEGDRLPSIRQLSQELNVSINTVKEAYWRLENRQVIEAVPQSGFYVKKNTPELSAPAYVDPSQLDLDEISLCQIYGVFQSMGACTPKINMGIASLNPEFWPSEKMGRFIQEALREQESESFNYLMPPGYLPLREQIARIGLSMGLNLSPDDIIITNGCHEAVFLAFMTVCKPGDLVVFESPMYFNLLHLIRMLDLKIIEIPSSPTDGMNLDTLKFVIDNYPVKAVFSISNFNNPMGYYLCSDKKQQMVTLLSQYRIPMIEDDIYGDLSFQERPDTCKSYDIEGDVILCSSFSKTLSPGLRIGWMVPPSRLRDKVIKVKTLLNISTASINQIAVALFLKEGGYERHVRFLRSRLREQVQSVRACILKYFPPGTRVTNPKGGFLLWIELPHGADTQEIYRQAIVNQILIAPGRLFSLKGRYAHCMRLNAGVWNDQVASAIQYLGEVCASQLGI